MNSSESIGKHTKLDSNGEPVESEVNENYQPKHTSPEDPWQDLANNAPDFDNGRVATETIDHDPLAIPEDVAERIKEYEQTYDGLLLDARKAETVELVMSSHKKNDIPLYNLPKNPTYKQFMDISTKLEELQNKLLDASESRIARELILKIVMGEPVDKNAEQNIKMSAQESHAAGEAADELYPYYMTKESYDYCTGTKRTTTKKILEESTNLLTHKWEDDDYYEAKELLKYGLSRELAQFEDREPDAPKDTNANLFRFVEKPISLEDRVKLLIARKKLTELVDENKHNYPNDDEEEL